jgi:dienelactone hydrolase
MRVSRRRLAGLVSAAAVATTSREHHAFAQSSTPVATPVVALSAEPTLHVSSKSVRIDEAFEIWVDGLQPDDEVTISSSFGGWSAEAIYRANEYGYVAPSEQVPERGTFDVADSMAFIWAATSFSSYYRPGLTIPDVVTITASMFGKTFGSMELERHVLSVGYPEEYISNDDMVAYFYPPIEGAPTPAPAILLLGTGGVDTMNVHAGLLAAEGYAVLYLGYFGAGTLPQALERIPLEYFGEGIAWMQQHPLIQPARIGLMGMSRGGELGLLVGSLYPEITAVVSIVGSGYALSGIGPDGHEASAWTWQGEDVPHLTSAAWSTQAADSFPAWLRVNEEAIRGAEIPVEQINGPVVLVSGDADGSWPSTPLSRSAWERLQREGHPWPDQFLHYPGAGHGILMPYMPGQPRSVGRMVVMRKATTLPHFIPGAQFFTCSSPD